MVPHVTGYTWYAHGMVCYMVHGTRESVIIHLVHDSMTATTAVLIDWTNPLSKA